MLLSGVQGITDLITTPGLINLDFADVKSVMQGAGSALMGIGSARGDDRAVAGRRAGRSPRPLLEACIDGAHGVLLSIQGGSDLGLFEINEAARLVQEAAHPEANIIFGAVIDDALGDEVRVTVIAAGFDGGGPVKRDDDRALGQIAGSHGAPSRRRSSRGSRPTSRRRSRSAPRPAGPAPAGAAPSPQPPAQQPSRCSSSRRPRRSRRPSRPAQQEPVARPPRTVTFDDNDDLDVPDFLK